MQSYQTEKYFAESKTRQTEKYYAALPNRKLLCSLAKHKTYIQPCKKEKYYAALSNIKVLCYANDNVIFSIAKGPKEIKCV